MFFQPSLILIARRRGSSAAVAQTLPRLTWAGSTSLCMISSRTMLMSVWRPNGTPFLPSAFFCGFRASPILPGYYPTGIARSFGPFVDLLLTCREDSKKPRGEAGRMCLIMLEEFGCGGVQPTMSQVRFVGEKACLTLAHLDICTRL